MMHGFLLYFVVITAIIAQITNGVDKNWVGPAFEENVKSFGSSKYELTTDAETEFQ